MSLEENKAIVRRFLEAFNEHDMAAMEGLSSPEIYQGFRQALEWTSATYPGHLLQITDMVVEGDKVWVRVQSSGGYAGGWMGLPPTDKQWTNRGVFFFGLAEGKIVAAGNLFDVWNHIQQLGATIAPPKEGAC